MTVFTQLDIVLLNPHSGIGDTGDDLARDDLARVGQLGPSGGRILTGIFLTGHGCGLPRIAPHAPWDRSGSSGMSHGCSDPTEIRSE